MADERIESIEQFLQRVPDPAEVRQQIAINLRERRLLQKVLKLAEQRQSVQEVVSR